METKNQTWKVVGGGSQGGILVRKGQETQSEQENERLSTGARVKELQLVGGRLQYEKLSGLGPEKGWVSIALKDKDLLIRCETSDNVRSSSELVSIASENMSGRPNDSPSSRLDDSDHQKLLTLQSLRAARSATPITWWSDKSKLSASVEGPSNRKTGLLPLIPRENRNALPTLSDLPEKIQQQFTHKSKTPYARMFCFYGIGDSAGQWMHFVDHGPSWCEIIVYECRAHGVRLNEPWDVTYEERAEDAWQQLLPAFKELSMGGSCEGAPFAFYCHSGGTVLVCLLSQRLRAEFGLEPLAVYIADQRPPNMPFLNESGLKMAQEDPVKYINIWQPSVGQIYSNSKGLGGGKLICERWTIGLLMLEEFYRNCEECFHMFHCPLLIFYGHNFSNHVPEDLPAEVLDWLKLKNTITWKDGVAAMEDEVKLWSRWTTKECTFIQVAASHEEIWHHMDTEIPLWRSFIELAEIHDRMPKKANKKRDY